MSLLRPSGLWLAAHLMQIRVDRPALVWVTLLAFDNLRPDPYPHGGLACWLFEDYFYLAFGAVKFDVDYGH
jgi:hypothetical protein